MSDSGAVIESVLKEQRKFAPPADFASQAHVKSFEQYKEMCAEAEKDPEAFERSSYDAGWATRWKNEFGNHGPWHELERREWMDGRCATCDRKRGEAFTCGCLECVDAQDLIRAIQLGPKTWGETPQEL